MYRALNWVDCKYIYHGTISPLQMVIFCQNSNPTSTIVRCDMKMTLHTLPQIPNVMVTFVRATFVLVTFVHIRNISTVTDPILMKL